MGSAQDFILFPLCLVWIKKIEKQGEYKILNINGREFLHRFFSSYRKLFDRVAFGVLLDIYDGASLRKCAERFLDDWANGACVDGLPHVWWASTLGSWSYYNTTDFFKSLSILKGSADIN